MGKHTKKRTFYNEEILNQLEDMYGYTRDYIQKSLRDDRTGIMPDKIKKSYKELENAAKQAIQNAVKTNQ